MPQDGSPADLRTGIHAFRKRGKEGCGIACLKMLLNLPFDVTARAVHLYNPTAASKGVWMCDLQRAATDLGFKLRRLNRKDYDLLTDTGILGVTKAKYGHTVLLARGVVIDPDDNTVWSADAYLKHYGLRPTILLVREDAHVPPHTGHDGDRSRKQGTPREGHGGQHHQ